MLFWICIYISTWARLRKGGRWEGKECHLMDGRLCLHCWEFLALMDGWLDIRLRSGHGAGVLGGLNIDIFLFLGSGLVSCVDIFNPYLATTM